MSEIKNISTTKSEGQVKTTVRTNNYYKNSEGHSDPTAGKVIKNMDRDFKRFRKLLDMIFSLCELSGFHLEERIVVKDVKSGRIWR